MDQPVRNLRAIPHREPFLLVDEILEWSEERIVCSKIFTGHEDFLPGITRAIPSSPACSCARRPCSAGAILLSRTWRQRKANVPVATRMNDVRFKRMVRPGETIRMEVELTERLADAFFLKAKVTVDGQGGRAFRVRLHRGCGPGSGPGRKRERRGEKRRTVLGGRCPPCVGCTTTNGGCLLPRQA